MPGYLYILKNGYMPNLVKIGFTERDPKMRAAELSGNTGVPGNFEIIFSWFVADAADVEKRVHLELAAYRRTGEFFELTAEKARASVANALKLWGVIGADGLSFDGRKVKEQEAARVLEERQKAQHKQDICDFELAMHSIIDELEYRERQEGAKVYSLTEPKGFLSFFKSSDTPERRDSLRKGIQRARTSLVSDLGMHWIFSSLKVPTTLSSDAYFIVGNSCPGKVTLTSVETYNAYVDPFFGPIGQRTVKQTSSDLRRQIGDAYVRRMPKGVRVLSSRGWRLDDTGLRKLINTASGETIEWIRIFSPKRGTSGDFLHTHDGRHFSDEANLGAYHCESLRFFVGQIPESKESP